MSQDDESKCNTAYQYFKCAKPLDFSYRNLVSLEELNGNEEPLPLRVRGAPKKSLKSNRYKTGSFWLNKNNLKNVNGLRNLADRLFEMADYLSWLDLSDNNLTSISDVRIPAFSKFVNVVLAQEQHSRLCGLVQTTETG
ncbi:leucine-rich repeat-containing protein 51-like isoform X2 [Acyrthosiphon pisum]|uniref:Leucine-rich repeat-containing protein 51 n=1 Tax=Acyrthosiphon pisum TaxID=7029 RepID=A0A8R2D3Z4_ACYPI|nr:leucine-rich repeat-containing protein 51-like isoform X2 [Acyrthosiphon pisum]|eukprot:XP_016659818.1 PREDICTED: leucine-rich repeat-containing protein 51-like isoform X2 [Acyrthosiphon pisum]